MSLHKHHMHVWLHTHSDFNSGQDNLNCIQIVTDFNTWYLHRNYDKPCKLTAHYNAGSSFSNRAGVKKIEEVRKSAKNVWKS